MSLHPALEARFEALLAGWRGHEDLRRRSHDVRMLAASRARLDRLRAEVAELRIALHPDDDELDEIALVSRCGTWDTLVFHRHIDRDPTGSFRCVCGDAVMA